MLHQLPALGAAALACIYLRAGVSRTPRRIDRSRSQKVRRGRDFSKQPTASAARAESDALPIRVKCHAVECSRLAAAALHKHAPCNTSSETAENKRFILLSRITEIQF